MREALGFARRDSVLLALLASKATFAMGAGIVGLLAVLVTEELGGGDTETGLIIGVRGLGVALGPLIAVPFARASLGRVLAICGWRARSSASAISVSAWRRPSRVALPLVLARPSRWRRAVDAVDATACRRGRPTTCAVGSSPVTSAW